MSEREKLIKQCKELWTTWFDIHCLDEKKMPLWNIRLMIESLQGKIDNLQNESKGTT